MKIVKEPTNSNIYVQNPSFDRQNRRISLMQRGCSHFMLIESDFNDEAEIGGDAFLDALRNAPASVFGQSGPAPLPGTSVRVCMVTLQSYLQAGQRIPVDLSTGIYTVLGCLYRREEDALYVYFPQNLQYSQVIVHQEIRYSVEPFFTERRRFFRTETVRTPYYCVNFRECRDYRDGSVYYVVGEGGPRYPVTAAMLGRSVLIKSPERIPEFRTNERGIVLIKE